MSTGQSNKVVFGLAEVPAAAGLLVTGDERLGAAATATWCLA
jgi:hypothetical protein